MAVVVQVMQPTPLRDLLAGVVAVGMEQGRSSRRPCCHPRVQPALRAFSRAERKGAEHHE
jgi:hypothetical protein